jgi:hypothetical protein
VLAEVVCCVLKSRRIGWSRRGTEKGKMQHDGIIDETRSGLDWTRTRGRQCTVRPSRERVMKLGAGGGVGG